MQRKTMAWALLGVALVACSGSERAKAGRVMAVVSALTRAGDISRVKVSIEPAGISQDLARDAASGQFVGLILCRPGAQTVTATAFAGDRVAGAGSVDVVVVRNETVSAYIRILDTSGPAPVPDHGPVVASVVVSNVNPIVGESIHLEASAIDPDGDLVGYIWTQDCASGAFTSTTTASTDWSSTAPERCRLVVTATAGGLSESVTASVTVFPSTGEGGIDVAGVFVEQPIIDYVSFSDGEYWGAYDSHEIRRDGRDATLRMPVHPGQMLNVIVGSYTFHGANSPAYALADDCGGTTYGAGPMSSFFTWRAPMTAGLCMLTATETVDGLTDRFPIAVLVAGCPDDPYENNDVKTQASGSPYTGGWLTDLFANDDDWYCPMIGAQSEAVVTLRTDASIPVEIVSPDGTVLAAGVNTATAQVPLYSSYCIHVQKPAGASACGPRYDLAIGTIVSVSPASATVPVDGTVQFTATVIGTMNQAVSWSVSNPMMCGWIDLDGLYHAPTSVVQGCQVIATSAGSWMSATAALTIVAAAAPGP